MFPLNVVAAAAGAGKEGVFTFTAGNNTSDIFGYRNNPLLSPPNDFFGTIDSGIAFINDVEIAELTTITSLGRWAFALTGSGHPDDDTSWIQFEITGTFSDGGPRTEIVTRAGLTFAGGNPTTWRGGVSSIAFDIVTGNVYDVVVT